jgi:hypothetical protein
MLWPRPFEWLVAHARSLVDRTDQTAGRTHGGNVGGFFLGTTLGLVWTPCAGPVLGSILTVIATSPHIRREALLLVVYAIGAAVPMLAIAYGGQFVTTRVRSVARFRTKPSRTTVRQVVQSIQLNFHLQIALQNDLRNFINQANLAIVSSCKSIDHVLRRSRAPRQLNPSTWPNLRCGRYFLIPLRISLPSRKA